MKEVVWHTKALEEIRKFPDDIKRNLGYLIHRLQQGDHITLPHSKPIKSVEIGVNELRIKNSSGAYRVFYYLKIQNGILIFHAFKKKTQKTPIKELQMGKKHLKELLNER